MGESMDGSMSMGDGIVRRNVLFRESRRGKLARCVERQTTRRVEATRATKGDVRLLRPEAVVPGVWRDTTRVTTGTNEGSRVVEKAAASPTAKGEALARAREASPA